MVPDDRRYPGRRLCGRDGAEKLHFGQLYQGDDVATVIKQL